MAFMTYHIIYLTHGDDVCGRDRFESPGDDAAKVYARRFLQSPFGKGYEIWQGARLVDRSFSTVKNGHHERYKSSGETQTHGVTAD
jgi:hypothetical protein